MKRRHALQLGWVTLLSACGGGGSSNAPQTPATTRLVGEIFGTASELTTSPFATNAGYSGNLATSRAIQKAGKANLLDFLFLFDISATGSARLRSDAATLLQNYIADNKDLLTPGVRLYLLDEMFLKASQAKDDPAEYQSQLNDLQSAVALLRQTLPQAKLGVSFSPYATFNSPRLMPFILAAVQQLDWIGTTPYWLGDKATVNSLHDWSRNLPGLVKSAKPSIETWYIAQAYREPSWDLATFRDYIQTELQISDRYDAIIFFGWQETSELSAQTAGRYFDADTRKLYSRFFQP